MYSTSCHFKEVKLERVMIFIDGSNFYHGLKKNNVPTNIHFGKFCDKLCGERRLIQTHYYNVPLIQSIDPKNYQSQRRFFNMLEKIPYLKVHYGRFVRRTGKFTCADPSCGKALQEVIIKCPLCSNEQTFKIPPFFLVEKGIDASIAVDMLGNAFDNTYDTAILVSADGDFVPVVREVKRLRKQVENAYFPQSPATFLSQNCDHLISLNKNYIKDCLLPKQF